ARVATHKPACLLRAGVYVDGCDIAAREVRNVQPAPDAIVSQRPDAGSQGEDLFHVARVIVELHHDPQVDEACIDFAVLRIELASERHAREKRTPQRSRDDVAVYWWAPVERCNC